MIDLSLNVRRGAFRLQLECGLASPWTVVFGPSGAGKSTLLRLIAGLERAGKGDAARIAVRGDYVTDSLIGLHVEPRRRRVGLVAQQAGLFPHLSVQGNVTYGLAELPRTTQEERVQSVLALVGAGQLRTRMPRDLSGGETQRVALARALAPQPRLLLLDEPLSALDAAARDALLANVQSWLADRSIQTILVTHDAADALATSAEVALIQEGRLTALGPAQDVLFAERERLLRRLRLG